MNCSKRESFIVKGTDLACCKKNNLTIKLGPKKSQIIKGTVYNQRQEPCEGAVVLVLQINCKNKVRKLLGYVITGEEGEYLFAIEAKPYMKYELTIYAPLI